MSSVDIMIMGGALAELPAGPYGCNMWSTASDAVKWCAVVEPNGASPGGMDRTFLAPARGEDTYYLVREIEAGQILELACDRVYGDDRKRRRLYLHVIAKSDDKLTVNVCYSLKDAVKARIAQQAADTAACEAMT